MNTAPPFSQKTKMSPVTAVISHGLSVNSCTLSGPSSFAGSFLVNKMSSEIKFCKQDGLKQKYCLYLTMNTVDAPLPVPYYSTL